jgi:hypothetical protein
MEETKERKILVVYWNDITSTDSAWRSEEDALEWSDSADSIVRQVGFLLSQDEDYLTLICSYIPALELVGTTIRIPKPTIKSITEIMI